MRASAHSTRCTSCSADISSEKTATEAPCFGGVDRHVERERGLSDRGARGEDDEVAGVHAGQQLVEFLEAGGHAGHVLLALEQLLELREGDLQQLVDRPEVARDPLVGDLEDEPLGVLDDLVEVVGCVVAHRHDLRRCTR